MDIRDRVMGDQPQDFLHKIASMVPGYSGYADRDKRRDADKLLRTELAKRYTAQRERLNRAQQQLVRARHFDQVAEVDRVIGVFQRFIDRLNTATYGYTGLFDPVKVEASDLDQIYAFDMALADGVDQVSSAIDAVDSAVGATDTQELPAALTRLSNLVDDLNARLNQRSDYLTSGRSMPQAENRAMVSGTSGQGTEGAGAAGAGASSGGGYAPQSGGYVPPAQAYQPNAGYSQPQTGYQQEPTYYPPTGYAQNTPGPSQNPSYNQPPGAQPTGGATSMTNEPNLGSGAYSQPGGGADVGSGDQGGTGAPTTNLNMQTEIPNEPGMGQMLDEGQTSHGDMAEPTGMGNYGTADPQMGGGPDIPGSGVGIETASSPSHSTDPNAPGHTLSEGLSMSGSLGTPDTGGGAGSSISDLPGTGTSTGGTTIGGAPGTGTGSSTDV